MIVLRASLLCNVSTLSYNHLPPLNLRQFYPPASLSRSFSIFVKSRFYRHRFVLCSALHSDNISFSSSSESAVSNDAGDSVLPELEESPVDNLSNETEVSVRDSKIEEERLATEDSKSRLPTVVFLLGLYATIKKKFEHIMLSEWFNWWLFWREEKRLERLIAEADANPKDAIKQGALLADLNKHNLEAVIKRFERRDHAVDSRGVAEYIKALVVTIAMSF